jgi:hypothetical protein
LLESCGEGNLGPFALPDQVQKIKASLPVGQRGWQKEIHWQLWVYGPVMFFVDEADATQYLAVTVDKKKPPPQEHEQPEQQESQ